MRWMPASRILSDCYLKQNHIKVIIFDSDNYYNKE